MQHGDLIAFSYASEDPEGADDWFRPQDFLAARLEAEEAAAKRAERAVGHVRWSGPGSSSSQRPRRQERALSLGSEDSYEVGGEDDDASDGGDE